MTTEEKPKCLACDCIIEPGQEATHLDGDTDRVCFACELDWQTYLATKEVPTWREECALADRRNTAGEVQTLAPGAPWIATKRTDPQDFWKAKMLAHIEALTRDIREAQGVARRAADDREYRAGQRRNRRQRLDAEETKLHEQAETIRASRTTATEAWAALPAVLDAEDDATHAERDLAHKRFYQKESGMEADLLERSAKLIEIDIERVAMIEQEAVDLEARDLAELVE